MYSSYQEIRIADNAAALVRRHLILIQNPLQRGTVAKPIRNASAGTPASVSDSLTTICVLSLLRRIFSTRQENGTSRFSTHCKGYSSASS